MRLLGAVFLCTGLVNLVQGALVDNFDKCNQFFLARQPPTFDGQLTPDYRKDYRLICQTQNGRDYEYFTLYDTRMKIPLYSAYRFHKRLMDQIITRDAAWKIEPQYDIMSAIKFVYHIFQLDGSRLAYMSQIRSSEIPVKDRGIHQAVNRDYHNSGYDKGHLYPVNHAYDQKAADGTFTLTNAAPQNCMFNKEWYNKVERVVAQTLENCEHGFMYVVTGVIYSNNKLNNRVNVPSHYWTAYCCENKFSGGGVVGPPHARGIYTQPQPSFGETFTGERRAEAART
uniref:Endonuclease domain-containing 1 protein-like n=1 Tax=Astyanax mexicanus TaxID=7994 RepID=A0A3B1ILF3_ASTMX